MKYNIGLTTVKPIYHKLLRALSAQDNVNLYLSFPPKLTAESPIATLARHLVLKKI